MNPIKMRLFPKVRERERPYLMFGNSVCIFGADFAPVVISPYNFGLIAGFEIYSFLFASRWRGDKYRTNNHFSERSFLQLTLSSHAQTVTHPWSHRAYYQSAPTNSSETTETRRTRKKLHPRVDCSHCRDNDNGVEQYTYNLQLRTRSIHIFFSSFIPLYCRFFLHSFLLLLIVLWLSHEQHIMFKH